MGPQESTASEIRDLRRIESILQGRNSVLQMLAIGSPYMEVLGALATETERALPGLRCSILLLDHEREHLRYGISPSLPAFYNEAVDGLRIGPTAGSCGAAAFTKKRVIAEDVMVHPNWPAYRELAARAAFRACWSEPIVSTDGAILGTFAMYHAEPHGPDKFELDFIHRTAQIAGIAIEHGRAKEERIRSEERFRQLAEAIREIFWLTDWETRKVLYVSPAYEEIWGRSCESLLADGRSWSYDIHPDDRERAIEAFDSAGDGSYDVEYRILRPDGSERWIHDRAFPILDGEGRVYRIAGLSEDMTEYKRTEEALREAPRRLDARTRRKLRSLTTELFFAEERERRKLSVDLHDGLNQVLALTRMKLADLRGASPDGLRDAIGEVEALVDQANQSARSLTFQLSPPILHDLGFEPAVQWLVEDVRESYGLSIDLEEHDGPPLPLGDRIKILLFRAVRELLINVAKHARADRATVKIEPTGTLVRIWVVDDGQAFVPKKRGSRGLGLDSIQERLNNIGGSMSIDSHPERGTTIILEAPLSVEVD